MAWSAPYTPVVGDMATHTNLNTRWRDQMNETAPAKVTTAGDLVAATGVNAIARVPVGSNDQYVESLSSDPEGIAYVSTKLESGTIGFFTGSCLSGWTEYTTSRGRYIVGMPSGGTINGTVGKAFTSDQQDDTHTHTGPSHTHSMPVENASSADVLAAPTTPTNAAGTGATVTAPTSSQLPYIQLRLCRKD